MLRMAIVDTGQTAADLARLAVRDLHYIQLRDLSATAAALFTTAEAILAAIAGTRTRLLINTRADIALATHAHGVHLRSHSQTLTPGEIRTLYARHKLPSPTISISCHTLADISRARTLGADLALFGPVFEKRLSATEALPGTGVEPLHAACIAALEMPVLALGGITDANTPQCLAAGAAGIAAIRLFNR